MAWIGTPRGIFLLHRSDEYCGSYLTVDDAAEILDVPPTALETLSMKCIDDQRLIDELAIHKAWGSGKIPSPHSPKDGNVARSFDELIVRKLLQITLPGCQVECQIPFGRKRVDLSFSVGSRHVLVEFVGPSHFVPQYGRAPKSSCVYYGPHQSRRASSIRD
jgi:hypothetical protein